MASKRTAPTKSSAATTYDAPKEFEGKRYTGMAVGRRHKWKYDAGDWSEKKVTPDKWEFSYSVVKRRAGHAPEGSGAPVGTSYRWYILANQVVTKSDANSYTTEMVGLKYKLAHKRADKETWSSSDAAQRKRLVQVLQSLIAELEVASPAQPAAAQSAPRRIGSTPVATRAPQRKADAPAKRATRKHAA